MSEGGVATNRNGASELVSLLGRSVFFIVTIVVVFGWARSATTTGSRVLAYGLLVVTAVVLVRALLSSVRRVRVDG